MRRMQAHRTMWVGVLAVALCVAASAEASTCVLFNRMESALGIADSEIGPGGTIVGSNYAFEPAQHGNGYVRKAVGQYVSFPGAVLADLTHRGTVEMWINPKVSAPTPYQYGIFSFVGAAYGHYGVPGSDIALSWGDGVTGRGFAGGVGFGGTWAGTPAEPAQFYATPGEPFHVAMCWDIDGIDGTADTIRVYRDGAVVGSTGGMWDATAGPTRDITLGYGADAGGYDRFITDNLKIWDGAVTDFSHRFDEMHPVPEPLTAVAMVGGLGVLAGYVRRRTRSGG